jgi:hypothetical protein
LSFSVQPSRLYLYFQLSFFLYYITWGVAERLEKVTLIIASASMAFILRKTRRIGIRPSKTKKGIRMGIVEGDWQFPYILCIFGSLDMMLEIITGGRDFYW